MTGQAGVVVSVLVHLPASGVHDDLHGSGVSTYASVDIGSAALLATSPEVLEQLGRVVEAARAALVEAHSGQNVLPFVLPSGRAS